MKDLKPLKPNLEKEIDKIRKKKHTSINWYDLDSEIDRIEDFDTFEEKEVLLDEWISYRKQIKKTCPASLYPCASQSTYLQQALQQFAQ